MKLLGAVLIWGNIVFSLFANLKVLNVKYAEYKLCNGSSRIFLKIFRTTFSKNTAGRTLLVLCDCSLKISRATFNPLMPGVNKRSYILKQTSNWDLQVCLSMSGLLLQTALKGTSLGEYFIGFCFAYSRESLLK